MFPIRTRLQCNRQASSCHPGRSAIVDPQQILSDGSRHVCQGENRDVALRQVSTMKTHQDFSEPNMFNEGGNGSTDISGEELLYFTGPACVTLLDHDVKS